VLLAGSGDNTLSAFDIKKGKLLHRWAIEALAAGPWNTPPYIPLSANMGSAVAET
jgi:hypothetical protein